MKDLKKEFEEIIDNEITKGGAFGFQKDMDRVVNKLTKLFKKHRKEELKKERIKLIREILPDIHRLRANIPMTPTNSARQMAKKLIGKLDGYLKKNENDSKE